MDVGVMRFAEEAETDIPAASASLRLEGSWTIERTHELKHALIEALRNGNHIIVGLEDLSKADLSCLELLCSAHKKSLKKGKSLVLGEKKSESFRRVVREKGFKRNLGCHKHPLISCLCGEWK